MKIDECRMLESLRSGTVGWVEPTPGIVGFRYTQPNLHFGGAITKCETQQKPISHRLPKVSFPIRPAVL
ncbi:hypothetical protein D1AOALGA4SA_6531 [Olavius algarvensis Delta 1 endosymbiont]|nr:hypothetical protein D1AOALGA4SA_6531 [Olavius algarvensis Delta 1 endosymbiont]